MLRQTLKQNMQQKIKELILDFIQLLEEELGIQALKEYEKMQPGDVENTSSDGSSLRAWIGSINNTPMTIIAVIVTTYHLGEGPLPDDI